jgi:hypothetical protein
MVSVRMARKLADMLTRIQYALGELKAHDSSSEK